jgi:hypothetical protein
MILERHRDHFSNKLVSVTPSYPAIFVILTAVLMKIVLGVNIAAEQSTGVTPHKSWIIVTYTLLLCRKLFYTAI